MAASTDPPWYWEGRVQGTVETWLEADGWVIESVADTARKTPGKDILATRNDLKVWVSVKGFPRRSARTHPATQARHWFAAALMDIALYRGEDAAVVLAVALPDFPTYRTLARRVEWLRRSAPFAVVWVSEDGAVVLDGGLDAPPA